MENRKGSRRQTYFFRHDEYTRKQLRVQAMMSKYSVEGYGRYWILVEMMRAQEGYMLAINDKHFYPILSKELECTPEAAKQFVEDCVNEYQLFRAEGGNMWCDALLENMEYMEVRSKNGRNAAIEMWRQRREGIAAAAAAQAPPVDQPQSVSNADAKQLKDNTSQEQKGNTTTQHSNTIAQEHPKDNESTGSKASQAVLPPTGVDDMREDTYFGRAEDIFEKYRGLVMTKKQREEIIARYGITEAEFASRFQVAKNWICGGTTVGNYRALVDRCFAREFGQRTPVRAAEAPIPATRRLVFSPARDCR